MRILTLFNENKFLRPISSQMNCILGTPNAKKWSISTIPTEKFQCSSNFFVFVRSNEATIVMKIARRQQASIKWRAYNAQHASIEKDCGTGYTECVFPLKLFPFWVALFANECRFLMCHFTNWGVTLHFGVPKYWATIRALCEYWIQARSSRAVSEEDSTLGCAIGVGRILYRAIGSTGFGIPLATICCHFHKNWLEDLSFAACWENIYFSYPPLLCR